MTLKLIVIFIVIVFSYVGVSIITFPPSDVKKYKKYYKSLSELKFYLLGEKYVIGYDPLTSNDMIYFDLTDHSIIINRSIHLFRYVYINPAGEYWRRKYYKWLDKNINIDTLPTDKYV